MRFFLALALVAALSGCDKDDEQVDVPFKGYKVPKGDSTKPKPVPTASDSATSPKPVARPTGVIGIASCCGALRAAARSATKAGDKKGYQAAASVCDAKNWLVRQGKLRRAAALSQVRTSILGRPPSACR